MNRTENVKASPPTDELAQFLLNLEIVHPIAMQRATKLTSRTELPLGISLIILQCMDQSLLRAIMEALTLVKDNLITESIARESLEIVVRNNWSLADALVVQGLDAHAVKRTRLGELLGSAHNWQEDQLLPMLGAADLSGLPLGKVLVLADELSEPCLDIALGVQKQIRLGDLDRDDAILILQKHLKNENQSDLNTHHFRDLLHSAHILDSADYRRASEECRTTNALVSNYLVESKRMSPEIMVAALRFQEMLWSKQISAAEACNQLQRIHERQRTLVTNGSSLDSQTQLESEGSLRTFLQLTGYLTPELLTDMMTLASQRGLSLDVHSCDNELFSKLLKKVRPDDVRTLECAVVVLELVKLKKITVGQALINFAFAEHKRKRQSSIAC